MVQQLNFRRPLAHVSFHCLSCLMLAMVGCQPGNVTDDAPAVPSPVAESAEPVPPPVADEASPAPVKPQLSPLKQLDMAFNDHCDKFGYYPTIDAGGPDNSLHGLSWRVYLLPYLGEKRLFDQFRQDEPWNSPHNAVLISKMPPVFGNDPEGKTTLHLLSGPGTPFQSGKGVMMRDVVDGMSNTIMVVQAGPDTADFWTKPGGLPFDPTNPMQCLGAIVTEQESFTVMLMDGYVRQIPVTLDPEDFRRVAQHQDQERVILP